MFTESEWASTGCYLRSWIKPSLYSGFLREEAHIDSRRRGGALCLTPVEQGQDPLPRRTDGHDNSQRDDVVVAPGVQKVVTALAAPATESGLLPRGMQLNRGN